MTLSGEFDIKSLKYHQKQALWPRNPLKRNIIYDSRNFSFIICAIQKYIFFNFGQKLELKISFATLAHDFLLTFWTSVQKPLNYWQSAQLYLFVSLQSVLICAIQKSKILKFWAKIRIEDIIWGLGTCISLNILNTCAKAPWLLTKYTIRPFFVLTACTNRDF